MRYWVMRYWVADMYKATTDGLKYWQWSGRWGFSTVATYQDKRCKNPGGNGLAVERNGVATERTVYKGCQHQRIVDTSKVFLLEMTTARAKGKNHVHSALLLSSRSNWLYWVSGRLDFLGWREFFPPAIFLNSSLFLPHFFFLPPSPSVDI